MMETASIYQLLTNRNIGLLTEKQQEKISKTKIAISGLGGIGSPTVEMLCRLGFQRFSILDNGTFELTNLNRQIYCFTDTDALMKTDVTERYLKKINPNVEVEKFTEISEKNVDAFLDDVDVIVMGIDTVIPCLTIGRAAHNRNIPMVEGWAVLVGNVRVFNEQTPTLEEVYEMPTIGRSIGDIEKEEEAVLMAHTLEMVLRHIPGLKEQYPAATFKRLEETGEGCTLAPLTWLTCSMMATEVMKVVLKWGNLALAPDFATYDPIFHQTSVSK